MSLWEYKAITSGKGGFATPALLESYLNQLGADEWEIIAYRTQPENPLAFAGLARRPTQRDWTLEAAAAAAARAEADKLRAEFAAKFQAATNPSSAAASSKEDSGNPNRDDSFRRPRDTDSDQDPYALDDSSDEPEEVPAEDQLPTFFEAVRPHMRRNQKGPGHSVALEYLVKKFEMIEEDLMAALVEIGFAIPEDEDDKPVYIEYDGDIYWLNINRRGEVWINTREKPRPVFKTVKATRLTPEEASPEQPEGSEQPQREERDSRRGDNRHEGRNRRNEQRSANAPAESSSAASAPHAAAEHGQGENATGSSDAATPAEPGTSEKPSREAQPAAPLPTGLDILERIRPMMRRSRGGWSGTTSYLARALRHSEADLVAAFATIGLVVASNPGEKAPLVECGPFAYWLNKDGRGGIWINAREARRMRQELKDQGSGESAPAPDAAALVPTAEAPEGLVPGETHPVDAATPLHGAEAVRVSQDPSAAPASLHGAEQVSSASPIEDTAAEAVSSVQEPALASGITSEEGVAPATPATEVSEEPVARLATPPATLPLAGMKLLLKEFRPGTFSGELCFLAEKLSRSPEDILSILVATGLKAPEKVRERAVYVEHGTDVFWLNRNAKGELWLNSKLAKGARKEEEDAEGEEEDSSPESEASGDEKKPRRSPRPRKKSSGEA